MWSCPISPRNISLRNTFIREHQTYIASVQLLSSPILLEAAEFLIKVLRNCQSQEEARTTQLKDAYSYFPYEMQCMNYIQPVLSVSFGKRKRKARQDQSAIAMTQANWRLASY